MSELERAAIAAASITGYAVVVAFTTLPILAAIGVILGTRRASSGGWLAAGYAVGLAVVFVLAGLGAGRLRWPAWASPNAVVEVGAGIVLVVVAAVWALWERHRQLLGTPPSHRFLARVRRLGPLSCILVGFQFAFHPENLILTVAAASHTAQTPWPGRALVVLWFCLVGVSTVLVPTFMYVASADRARARLESLHAWLGTHGVLITIALVFVAGLVLIAFGWWRLAA